MKKDMIDWIQAHGSENLRVRACTGLPCEVQYLTERAKIEFPKWRLVPHGTYTLRAKTPIPTAVLRDLRDLYSDPRCTIVEDGSGTLHYCHCVYLGSWFDLVKKCPSPLERLFGGRR
jgi:hypothetical protein